MTVVCLRSVKVKAPKAPVLSAQTHLENSDLLFLLKTDVETKSQTVASGLAAISPSCNISPIPPLPDTKDSSNKCKLKMI